MTSGLRKSSPARPAAFLALVGGVLMIASGAAGVAGASAAGIDFGAFSPTLVAALFAAGAGAGATALAALKRARIAWAFAVSLHATLAIALLLAAPMLTGVGFPGPLALGPALLSGAIATLYGLAAGDFERSTRETD